MSLDNTKPQLAHEVGPNATRQWLVDAISDTDVRKLWQETFILHGSTGEVFMHDNGQLITKASLIVDIHISSGDRNFSTAQAEALANMAQAAFDRGYTLCPIIHLEKFSDLYAAIGANSSNTIRDIQRLMAYQVVIIPAGINQEAYRVAAESHAILDEAKLTAITEDLADTAMPILRHNLLNIAPDLAAKFLELYNLPTYGNIIRIMHAEMGKLRIFPREFARSLVAFQLKIVDSSVVSLHDQLNAFIAVINSLAEEELLPCPLIDISGLSIGPGELLSYFKNAKLSATQELIAAQVVAYDGYNSAAKAMAGLFAMFGLRNNLTLIPSDGSLGDPWQILVNKVAALTERYNNTSES